MWPIHDSVALPAEVQHYLLRISGWAVTSDLVGLTSSNLQLAAVQSPLPTLWMMWFELIRLCQKLQSVRQMLDGCRNVFKAQSAGCIFRELVSLSDL